MNSKDTLNATSSPESEGGQLRSDSPNGQMTAPFGQEVAPAGRQKGKDDERHLWPAWFGLIRECGPSKVFGEQVASAVAHGWLDDVYEGLEGEGYAVGSAVLPASSVGAPHKRDRLWFVAHAALDDDRGNAGEFPKTDEQQAKERQGAECNAEFGGSSTSNVADTSKQGLQGHGGLEQGDGSKGRKTSQRHHWEGGVWIDSPDGKQRLVEPGIRLLAHGVQHRTPILHAFGNAIAPQVAEQFIRATEGGAM